MNKRSAHHAAFVIERPYAASPPRAWDKSDHKLVQPLKELK